MGCGCLNSLFSPYGGWMAGCRQTQQINTIPRIHSKLHFSHLNYFLSQRKFLFNEVLASFLITVDFTCKIHTHLFNVELEKSMTISIVAYSFISGRATFLWITKAWVCWWT